MSFELDLNHDYDLNSKNLFYIFLMDEFVHLGKKKPLFNARILMTTSKLTKVMQENQNITKAITSKNYHK